MRKATLLALALGTTSLPALAHAAGDIQGPAFQAAMVYNFARFATWPPSRFANPTAPVVLCVGPNNRLAPSLSDLDGQAIGGRRLRVRVTSSFGSECHVAVLEEGASAAQVAAIQRDGVLTVSGGGSPAVVRLVNVGRQTRFEVNTGAAKEAGVTLSSQLLRLAVAVR